MKSRTLTEYVALSVLTTRLSGTVESRASPVLLSWASRLFAYLEASVVPDELLPDAYAIHTDRAPYPIYTCHGCAFETLLLDRITAHVASCALLRVMAPATPALPIDETVPSAPLATAAPAQEGLPPLLRPDGTPAPDMSHFTPVVHLDGTTASISLKEDAHG
jgi:hypothetical protein